MELLALIGLFVVVYYLCQIILWIILDCDIQLHVASVWGRPINSLEGKVFWITGVSSGIGRELAKVLAKNGVKLALSSRNVKELEAVKKECLTLSNGKLKNDDILVLPLDLLDFSKHESSFNRVVSHFGDLFCLVNNAGRSQRAEWNKIDITVDRELFELDVFSVINLSRLAVTYFEKHKIDGHIAVTSSIAGLIGAPDSASYTGAKHAIHGYFESLRTEKPHINVHLYCPGPTFSNFLAEAFTDTPGRKHDVPVQATDKRMTTDRCAYLYAVMIANNLGLNWAGIFPSSLITYVALYYPNVANFLLSIGIQKKLKKVRDSK